MTASVKRMFVFLATAIWLALSESTLLWFAFRNMFAFVILIIAFISLGILCFSVKLSKAIRTILFLYVMILVYLPVLFAMLAGIQGIALFFSTGVVEDELSMAVIFLIEFPIALILSLLLNSVTKQNE